MQPPSVLDPSWQLVATCCPQSGTLCLRLATMQPRKLCFAVGHHIGDRNDDCTAFHPFAFSPCSHQLSLSLMISDSARFVRLVEKMHHTAGCIHCVND